MARLEQITLREIRLPLREPFNLAYDAFQNQCWEAFMRTTLAVVTIVLIAGAASAAQKLTPKEIQAEFFDGKPFTAATTSGTKFKMTFATDGKVTREPQDKAGQKGEGTWKLSKEGFCTSWREKSSTCYTLVNVDKNKWSVVKGATTVAVWSK